MNCFISPFNTELRQEKFSLLLHTMHVSTLTLLSLTGTVMAIIPPTGVSCLTEPPSDMQKNTHAELAGIEATAASTASSLVTRDTINIDTYVHVVAASTRASDGYLSVRCRGLF